MPALAGPGGLSIGGRFCRRDKKKIGISFGESVNSCHTPRQHTAIPVSRHRYDEMDEFKKKRKLVVAADSKLPEKKQKTQDGAKKPSKKARRSVTADALRWRTAKLPDMFDDAEGFYGLEEVDDVEIIKHADNSYEFVGSCTAGTGWKNCANGCAESN